MSPLGLFFCVRDWRGGDKPFSVALILTTENEAKERNLAKPDPLSGGQFDSSKGGNTLKKKMIFLNFYDTMKCYDFIC